MNWTIKIPVALCVCLSATSAIFYPSYPIESSGSTEIDLFQFENKEFSQNGEDGVIQKIFEVIGFETGYYVEFDVEEGKESNTRFMREAYGWNGLSVHGGMKTYQSICIRNL